MNSSFFVIALALQLVLSCASPVPLFLWSGQRAFIRDHEQIGDALRVQDVHTSLRKIINPTSGFRRSSALDTHMASEFSSPEIIVAFVASKMGSSELARFEGGYSEEVSASNLQDVLSSAQSVLTAPFLFPEGGSLSDELVQTISVVSPQSQIVATQLTNESGRGSCDALLAHLQENNHLFSNGVSDLVLVRFPSYDQNRGQCMKRVMDYVKSRTDNHLALFSADQASQQVQKAFSSDDRVGFRRLPRRLLQASSNSTDDSPGVQYMTPTILFSILLNIMLLFILWQGLSCMLAIETPVRFAYAPPTHSLSKEY